MSDFVSPRRRRALYLVPYGHEKEHDMAALDQTLASYQEWLTAQGHATDTVRERLTVLRAFARTTAADPRSASTTDVIGYLARPGFSAWTRATYYGHLSCWFGYLCARGDRPDNPLDAMTPPRSPKSKPRPLSDAEEELLMGSATPMMRTWLTLGLYQGFRAMEIAKVRGVEINETDTYILGKGGRQDILPTHPRVWVEAQQYGRSFWFPSRGQGGHYQAETVSHNSSLYFTSLGIEGAIHRCRHTYATKLLRAGVNIRVVQTLMRHESLATTQRYTAVDEHERRSAVMLLRGAA